MVYINSKINVISDGDNRWCVLRYDTFVTLLKGTESTKIHILVHFYYVTEMANLLNVTDVTDFGYLENNDTTL